jgi:hypothetical protein
MKLGMGLLPKGDSKRGRSFQIAGVSDRSWHIASEPADKQVRRSLPVVHLLFNAHA